MGISVLLEIVAWSFLGAFVWVVFGLTTYEGIWRGNFNKGPTSEIEKVFVVVNWPIIVFAYAIARSYGFFFGKKK